MHSGTASAGRLLAALALATTVAAPASALQQEGQSPTLKAIVSRAVTFGTGESGLTLETNGNRIQIEFSNGVLSLGDEVIGEYTPEGALENSWRNLLARSVQMDDAELARALVEWAPPAEGGELGTRIDRALEEALTGPTALNAPAPAETPQVDGTLAGLLSRIDALGSLSQLLSVADVDEMRVLVGEDLDVPAGTEINRSVLVIDGDVDLRGRIRGDLLVADGDVELREGAVIDGDLRMAGGFLDRNGGEIRGDFRELEAGNFVLEADLRDQIRDEVRREIAPQDRTRSRSRPGFFSRIGRAIGALFDTLITAFIVGLLGVLVFHFGGDRFDRIAETARRNPGRAALVGGAAAFLSFPVWIIGAIALVISLIGIPAAIVWLPAFPLAVGLALVVGYTAVARNVGAWLSRQDYPGFDWVLVTRPNTLIFGGVFFLMLPFALGHILELGGGLLDTLQDLVTVAGFMMGLFVTMAGFGAVLMTRGGRRTDFEADDFFSDPGGGWGFEPPFGWGRKSDMEAFDEELAQAGDDLDEAADEADSTSSSESSTEDSPEKSSARKSPTGKNTTKKNTTKKSTTKKSSAKKSSTKKKSTETPEE